MSDRPGRGWIVFTEERPATILEDMRKQGQADLHDAIVEFSIELSVTVGSAIDAGLAPPGSPMDDLGRRYSTLVPGTTVILEYVVFPEIREIRIPALVWIA